MEETKHLLDLLELKFSDKISNLEQNSEKELVELNSLRNKLNNISDLLNSCCDIVDGHRAGNNLDNSLHNSSREYHNNTTNGDLNKRSLSNNRVYKKAGLDKKNSFFGNKHNLDFDIKENSLIEKKNGIIKSHSKEGRENNTHQDIEIKNTNNNNNVKNESINLSVSSKNKYNENTAIMKHTVSSLNKMRARNSTENGSRNQDFIYENSLKVYSKEHKNNKNTSNPRKTAFIPLDKSSNNKILVTESNLNNSASTKQSGESRNSKLNNVEQKYPNLNTSGNLADNGNTKKESEIESKIKRVNLPLPDKPKHRKTKSQIYEGNGPASLDGTSGTYNLTNYEDVTRSTDQSYQQVNTITGKSGNGNTSKRTSVIHEGQAKNPLLSSTDTNSINIVNGKSAGIKNRRISVPDRKITNEVPTDPDKKRKSDRRLIEINSKEKKVLKGGNGMQGRLKIEEDSNVKANNSETFDANKSIEIPSLIRKKEKINYFKAYKKNLKIVERITSFLNEKELNDPIKTVNKSFMLIWLKKHLDKVKLKKNEIMNKIKNFKNKYKEEEYTKEPAPLAITRGTQKAVELLNDPINQKIYESRTLSNPEIVMIYKIYLMLLNREEIYRIRDDSTFFIKLCDFFLSNSNGKLGEFVLSTVKDFDFSSENLYKIMKYYEKDIHKINPTYYSKICSTTSLFIFLLKDALEYSGIIMVEKKSQLQKIFNNYNYYLDNLEIKLSKLDNQIADIENDLNK